MNGSIPETVSPQKDMLTALEGFANNSSVAVPHTADVKQLEVQGTGEQFVKALKYNNSGIRKAILGDSVSTGEDDKGVRAAKEVSIDVVNLRVKSIKNTIADAVRRDVYRLLTVVNFGADKVRLTPRCSLGDTERHDWEGTAAALQKIGYRMVDEHMREGDVILNFTPRAKDAPINDPQPDGTIQQNDPPEEEE
jgi:phage gp29-like protein